MELVVVIISDVAAELVTVEEVVEELRLDGVLAIERVSSDDEQAVHVVVDR